MKLSATVFAVTVCLLASQTEARSGGERAAQDQSVIRVSMQVDFECTGRNCQKREFGAKIGDVDGGLMPFEAEKLDLIYCSGRNCSQRE